MEGKTDRKNHVLMGGWIDNCPKKKLSKRTGKRKKESKLKTIMKKIKRVCKSFCLSEFL
jgi:hypothetical protein